MAITPLDWTDAAACRNSEGALFYPADSAERKEDRLERELVAKRICASCGVREDCLEAGAGAPRVLRDLGRPERVRASGITPYVSVPSRAERGSLG